MIKCILIIATLVHGLSMKLIGHVCTDTRTRIDYCCHNSENINGTCTDHQSCEECQIGTYTAYVGGPCIVCPKNKYGPKCIRLCTTCKDLDNYRCDPVFGCVIVPEDLTTVTTTTFDTTSYNTTTVDATTYDTVMIQSYSHTRQEGIPTASTEKTDTTTGFSFTGIYLYSFCLTILFVVLLAIFCGKRFRKSRNRQTKESGQNNVPNLIEMNQLEERPYHLYDDINELVSSSMQDQSTPRENEQLTDDLHATKANVDKTCPLALGVTDRSDYLDPCFIADDGSNTSVSSDNKSQQSNSTVSGDTLNSQKKTKTGYLTPIPPVVANVIVIDKENRHPYQSLGEKKIGSTDYQKLYLSLQSSNENELNEDNVKAYQIKAENLHLYKSLNSNAIPNDNQNLDIKEDNANQTTVNKQDQNSPEYFEPCLSPEDEMLCKSSQKVVTT